MINQETIEEIKNRLVQVYNPEQIYLFGSYVWGQPTEDSDLDLLVIVNHSDEKRYKRSIKASDALWDIKISKDLLVFTASEFINNVHDQTTLCYKIKTDGKLLYARS